MELYVFEKVDKFVLPTSYDRYENGVTGWFTTESIRFYKVDATENYTYPFTNNSSIVTFNVL